MDKQFPSAYHIISHWVLAQGETFLEVTAFFLCPLLGPSHHQVTATFWSQIFAKVGRTLVAS